MRRSRRRSLLGAVATGLVGGVAGCLGFLSGNTTTQTQSRSWPMSGGDPRNTGVSRAASVPDTAVKRAWHADLDDQAGLSIDVVTGSNPVVADDTVYVSSVRKGSDGGFRVHALSVAGGEQRWRTTFENELEETSVDDGRIDDGRIAVDASRVYAGNFERLHALDRETGEELWSVDGPKYFPTPVDGTLYVYGRGTDGSLSYLGLDPETGDVRWSDDSTGDVRAHGPFAVAEDRLVALGWESDAFRLRGISLDGGETVWTHSLGSAGRPYPALVAVSGGVAVTGISSVVRRDESVDDFVVGVGVGDGEKRWRHGVDGFLVGGYALVDGTAHFTTTATLEGSTFVGVELDGGEVTLSESAATLYGGTPVSDGDSAVFADGGAVGAFGLEGGSVRWTDAADVESPHVAALGDGAVFGASRVKGITCYRPSGDDDATTET